MSYSNYPPNQYGGYPPGGYPPPNQYPIQQPPAPPLDPYVAWYADRLAELTFNSRPIIQMLSVEAMKQRDYNNWHVMQGIVEEIEGAILRAPPQGKLPLLYLIDSISKNVGSPYTDRLLPPILPRLYARAYRDVDGVTKTKLEEMVRLWRSSGPNGGDLYPAGVRETVERDIFGSTPPLSQGSVQASLRALLKAKQDEMALQFSNAIAKQVNVLVQLDQLLNSSRVSLKELTDIAEKIKAMQSGAGASGSGSVIGRLAPQTPLSGSRSPMPHPQVLPPTVPPFEPQHLPPRIPPILPPAMGSIPPPSFPPVGLPNFPPSIPAATSTPPIPIQVSAPAPVPAIPINVADILRNLNSSGILSQPRTPEIPSAPLKSPLNSYEEMILSLDVQIGFFDANKFSIPNAHLPVRCKQCGLRFPEGENKLQSHMDWHFRRNRKERETEGRGAHRRWLPSAEEWIHTASDESGPSTLSPSKAINGGSNGVGGVVGIPTKLSAERLALLKKKWVRAPSDSVKAAQPCPICKESFKPEWSEDEEEWIFLNAVDAHGQIYHATCRAEQMSSAMAARLLANEPTTTRSSSKSPKIPPAELSAEGGIKRKADGDEQDKKRVKVEGTSSDATDVGLIDGEIKDKMPGVSTGTTNPVLV